MVEVRASARPDLTAVLDRIEDAVVAGETDLTGLGFWRVVAQVKPDRVLVDAHAAQIGRIDTTAFRAGIKLRAPVWAGNVVLALGVAVGGSAVAVAFAADASWLRGVALIAAGAIWAVALHSPAHWLVGRAIGIRFTDYFLGGPPPPRPGLKSDYATYLRADADSRAWMHASGAIATKIAPFLALAFWPGSDAPWWSAVVLLVIGAGQILTDVTLSTKTSDWKKFLRERRVARSMEPVSAAPETGQA